MVLLDPSFRQIRNPIGVLHKRVSVRRVQADSETRFVLWSDLESACPEDLLEDLERFLAHRGIIVPLTDPFNQYDQYSIELQECARFFEQWDGRWVERKEEQQ